VQQDSRELSGAGGSPPLVGVTGIDLQPRDCCDFPHGEANQYDQAFLRALGNSLGLHSADWVLGGSPLPQQIPLAYLSQSAHRRCSWGRATAYFALAEAMLAGGNDALSYGLMNSTKDLWRKRCNVLSTQ